MKQHIHERPYVLTCDLQNKVKLFERIGLKVPPTNDSFFSDFQTELSRMIAESLGACGQKPEVRMIAMEELANDILSGAKKLLKGNLMRNGVIVSTCVEIASTSEDTTLAVNRIVDYCGQSYNHGINIGIGPRPGCWPIHKQIDNIGKFADGRPVIIVEDGIFTGGTLSKIVEMFQKARIKIEAIVVGFAFEGAVEKVKTVFDGEIVKIINNIDNPIDWMPDHDFFPFVPNSGKVVGHPIDGMLMPLYNHEGYSFSIPYIEPFADKMSNWTSIPPESTAKISEYCLMTAKEFFRRLEKDNNRRINLRDLLEIRPRISFPHRSRKSEFAIPDGTVYDFLAKAHVDAWQSSEI